jgi:hypothetical protein
MIMAFYDRNGNDDDDYTSNSIKFLLVYLTSQRPIAK